MRPKILNQNQSKMKQLTSFVRTVLPWANRQCRWSALSLMLLMCATAWAQGIAIKGELQMRVLKNSVDTWKFPHLFKGGTKDGYAIFNWKALEEENFMWWKKRMRVMSWYLDIYSIRQEDVCTKEEEPLYRKMIPQLVATSNMMGWGNGWESLRLLPVAKAEEKKQTPYLGAVYSSTTQ